MKLNPFRVCHACGRSNFKPAPFCPRCGALPVPAARAIPDARRAAAGRSRWRLAAGVVVAAAILTVVLAVVGRDRFGGSGPVHWQPLPPDEELLAPGQGEDLETNRLLDSWRAIGLTVETVIRAGKTNYYRVNGKVVRLCFITVSPSERHNIATNISGNNIEFLKSENGIMVFVINRAENVFIVPIARFVGCLGKIYTPPNGRQGYYQCTLIPGPANWMVQGIRGGVIDLAEFYGATDLFGAPGSLTRSPAPSGTVVPPDAELMAPGQGATVETQRLLNRWWENGWTVVPAGGGSGRRSTYLINGKTVRISFISAGEDNRNKASRISKEAIEFLKREDGFLVILLNRAETVFVIPIARFAGCLGEAYDPPGGGPGYYQYSFIASTATRKVQGISGGALDLDEFYGATDPLKP